MSDSSLPDYRRSGSAPDYRGGPSRHPGDFYGKPLEDSGFRRNDENAPSNQPMPPRSFQDVQKAADERVMRQTQLTRDELRVLKECNQESFWYRCVPFTLVCMTASQIAVNRGILRPHPKYGAMLKNLGAGLVGFLMGKMSYISVCKAKVMGLKNSNLAESLRRQHGIKPVTSTMEDERLQYEDDRSPTTSRQPGGMFSDTPSYGDMSSDSYQYNHQYDSPPSFGSQPANNNNMDGPQSAYREPTYADRRRLNREEYQKRSSGPHQQQQPPSSPPPPHHQPLQPPPPRY